MTVGAEVILVEIEGIHLECHFLAAVGARVLHQAVVFILVLVFVVFVVIVEGCGRSDRLYPRQGVLFEQGQTALAG